jgi:hypothetical protein
MPPLHLHCRWMNFKLSEIQFEKSILGGILFLFLLLDWTQSHVLLESLVSYSNRMDQQQTSIKISCGSGLEGVLSFPHVLIRL